jgi:hypothetical protein
LGLAGVAVFIFVLTLILNFLKGRQIARHKEEKCASAEKRHDYTIADQIKYYRNQQMRADRRRTTREIITIIGIGFTALFAFGSNILFYWQYGEMHQASIDTAQLARTAQQNLVLAERPWLYIKGDVEKVSEKTTFRLDAENIGSSIAVEIRIYGTLTNLTEVGDYTPGINYHQIPCVPATVRTPFGARIGARKTWSILPKRDEILPLDVDVDIHRIRAFVPQKYTHPYMVGCIQYQWPFGDEKFHTWFLVPVAIINYKTGEQILPFSGGLSDDDYAFRAAGKVSYIHAN